jgi:hypothetical protein
MSVIVEVITFDDNIYQVVTLFPDCRQCYNIGLPVRTTLKEALFVMCNGHFFLLSARLTDLCVALYFLNVEDRCVFLSQKDCFSLGTDLYRL